METTTIVILSEAKNLMRSFVRRGGLRMTAVVMLMVAPLLAEPYPFPNPFVAKRDTVIQFKDLPGPGTIKIFTIAGEEVITIPISPGDIIKPWNTLNAGGKKVASGVYFYLIESGGAEFKGKVVVIR